MTGVKVFSAVGNSYESQFKGLHTTTYSTASGRTLYSDERDDLLNGPNEYDLGKLGWFRYVNSTWHIRKAQHTLQFAHRIDRVGGIILATKKLWMTAG